MHGAAGEPPCARSHTPTDTHTPLPRSLPRSYIIPDGVFQAYKTYWEIGYKGHLAYAAAWLCK